MPSLNQRSRPARRWMASSLLSLLILVMTFNSITNAYEISSQDLVYRSVEFQEFEERGEIHFDTRPRPIPEMKKRQADQDPSSTNSASSSTPTASVSNTITTPSPSMSTSTPSNSTATTTQPSTPSTTVVMSALPSPFDTSIGNNFTTSSCPTFFANFLANNTFKSCTPISLLLQNSASFFHAQRSAGLLTATLDASCGAPISVCTPLMTSLASQLLADANCGQDFRDQQPLVLQAYNGLVAYEPVYYSTCIKDDSNSYCYADAVTNSTNPGDLYPYFTAIGINLPATAKPTCNNCLKQTMQVFAQYAVRAEQPLSKTYLPCAGQIDASCGDGFADTTVKAGSVGSGLGTQAQALKNAGARLPGGLSQIAVAVMVAAAVGVVML